MSNLNMRAIGRLALAGLAATMAVVTLAPLLAQTPRTVDLVVANGIVVTMDAERRVISPGSVAVSGSTIVGVGPADAIARDFRATDTIEARGKVVLPGLINTHTHAPMVLYRGLGDDLALMDWLQRYIFPGRSEDGLSGVRADRHPARGARDDPLGHDDLRRHVLLRGGDRPRNQGSGTAWSPRPDPSSSFPYPTPRRRPIRLKRAEAFIKQYQKDDLIVPAVAPHSVYTLDAATLKRSRDLAAATTFRC